MKYVPPINSTSGDSGYVNGNPATATQGSIPPAAAFEHPQREIVNIITDSQQVPTDQDLHQITRAIRDGKLLWCIDSGPLNAVQIPSLSPILLSYTPGLTLRVLIAHTNTGPTTVSVGSLNPTAIKRRDGSELQANDMIAGQIVTLVSDGTFFQLQNMGIGGTGGVGSTFKVDIPYVHDTGAQDPNQATAAFKNHVIGPYSPPLPDINEGRTVEVKLDQTILGPTDFTPNNFPTHPVAHPDGSPIVAGDGVPNQIWLLVFDSVQWQLLDVYQTTPAGPTIPAEPKGYVGRSLQFRPPEKGSYPALNTMPYLRRTPAVQGNRSVWTQSCFLKWSIVIYRPYYYTESYSDWDVTEAPMMSEGDAAAWWGGGAGDWTGVYLCGSDQNNPVINQYWNYSYNNISGQSNPQAYNGGVQHMGDYTQNSLASDTKWHHVCWVADGAYATFYVDGKAVSSGPYTYGAQGTVNSTREHVIGATADSLGVGGGTRARMAEFIFIDGQALTWDKFAKVVDGNYVPIDEGTNLGLTFGTNGFYLNWQDSSAVTATTLGKDWSGNSNNWNPRNFSTSQVYNDFPGNPTS